VTSSVTAAVTSSVTAAVTSSVTAAVTSSVTAAATSSVTAAVTSSATAAVTASATATTTSMSTPSWTPSATITPTITAGPALVVGVWCAACIQPNTVHPGAPNTFGAEGDLYQYDMVTCPRANSCAVNASTMTVVCTEGHIGVACAICNSGFYASHPCDTCAACPSISVGVVVLAVVALSAVCAALLWLARRHASKVTSRAASLMAGIVRIAVQYVQLAAILAFVEQSNSCGNSVMESGNTGDESSLTQWTGNADAFLSLDIARMPLAECWMDASSSVPGRFITTGVGVGCVYFLGAIVALVSGLVVVRRGARRLSTVLFAASTDIPTTTVSTPAVARSGARKAGSDDLNSRHAPIVTSIMVAATAVMLLWSQTWLSVVRAAAAVMQPTQQVAGRTYLVGDLSTEKIGRAHV